MAKNRIQPMPFSTADWLRCPELKVLPPDVRGLWMDLLCYMWESDQRGVMIKPTGEIYTREEITRMLGADASGSYSWLDTLIRGGVCAVRDDGAIYSRRMVRETEISEKRRAAGRKGGATTKIKIFDPAPQKLYPEQKPQPMIQAPTPPDPAEETPPPLTPEQQAKADKGKKYKYAENVSLTRDEYATLCSQHSEDVVKILIQILDNYKGSKGKRYKSDYRAILSWVVDKYNENLKKGLYGTTQNTPGATQCATAQSGEGYRTTI